MDSIRSELPAATEVRTLWVKGSLLVLLIWALLIALFEPTFSSMVAIWDSSETYTHGYIVLPISLWLIWRNRHVLAHIRPSANHWAVFAAAALSGMWLFGRVAGALVIEHYALVGLMIVAVWAILGWSVVWALLFPLAYLLMMVPVGDFLLAPLINFTADFTVLMVQAIGIPVFREGTFFTLPTGQWNVVTGCSGIRYFLASVVLGWLFAYLTYRTWWKRLAFGIAALIVPIVANGFRATLIVLIAHYSDMKLALGVDHFIYGWVWFGIVIFAMFLVGNIWREDEDQAAAPAAAPTPGRPAGNQRTGMITAVAFILVLGAFALYEHRVADRAPVPSPLAAIVPGHGWSAMASPLATWEPQWTGMDDQRLLSMEKGADKVMLYVAWYGTQRQDSELINSTNRLIREKHPEWRKTTETGRTVVIGDQSIKLQQGLLDSKLSGQRLVAWYWNRIDADNSTNIFLDKFILAWSKLLGRNDAGAVIILAAPYGEKPIEAEETMKRFWTDMSQDVYPILDKAMQ